MAVDPVPHHLTDEAANLLEALQSDYVFQLHLEQKKCGRFKKLMTQFAKAMDGQTKFGAIPKVDMRYLKQTCDRYLQEQKELVCQ